MKRFERRVGVVAAVVVAVMRKRPFLIMTAVLLAAAPLVTARPAGARSSSIAGAGVVDAPTGGSDLPTVVAVQQVDNGGVVEVCDVMGFGWHGCGLGAYGPGEWLSCWRTVQVRNATVWYGGARLGGYDEWFAVKIVDYGPGHTDRMGFQLFNAPASDGRCGAASVPTSPLIAGDFVTRR